MKSTPRSRLFFLVLILAVLFAPPASAQEKKVLTLDDYGEWKRISSTSLSPGGGWISFAYRPNAGDDTLYVKEIDGEGRYEIPVGSRPEFAPDSRWVAYMVSPPEEEVEKLRRSRDPVLRKVELRELATGTTHTVEAAESFTFSEDGRWFAVLKTQRDEDAEHEGRDLVLRDLEDGTVQYIGSVSEFAFDEEGSRLAYLVDADGKAGNGLYLLDLEESRILPLDGERKTYSGLSWDEEGEALAVLRGEEPEGKVQRENVLVAFLRPGERRQEKIVYDPASDASFPEGFVLSEFETPRWSKDRSRLFLGVKEQREKPPESDEPEADVDVWHWADEQVQSVQKVRANRDRRSTYASVLLLDGMEFLKLADEDMPRVSFTEDGRWGIGRLDAPYRHEITWGGSRADYYRIDTATGERQLMVEGLGRAMGTSPDSRWFLYLQDETLYVREIATGRTIDLTALSGVDFVNRQDDHPYELPAYGIAGWSGDGERLLAYHRYDIWSLPLDGGEARNLTAGVGDRDDIRFRYVRLDREEETIDLDEPLLLSAYGEWTKKSGYWEVRAGREPEPLLWVDADIGRVQKAEEADRFAWTRGTFEVFPDVWVSDTRFEDARQVTEANPQLDEYAWGRRILVDYENSEGQRLQATLTLPAGYEEGQRYPMLVYFYETMSQRHHSFSMPVYDDRPHMSTYASGGYLVLMPDIVYEIGRPGSSAMDCVGAAVRKVIELGYADPDHVGLQGHSWGGYQSSFMVTQTDMFAAVVTGAPPTNLVSFYNTLYKSSGTVQQGITEVGQVRMGTTPFEDFGLFVNQSPVHHAGEITTPFLILHGTEDGAVDWMQGLEYYNMARRQGKKVILLSYPGEGHHLGREANQKDFQIRMRQFFDHYLMGKPAPDWMTEGVPFLEKPYASPTDGLPPN